MNYICPQSAFKSKQIKSLKIVNGEKRISKVQYEKGIVINIKTMNQKFINLVEKTEKKAPVYQAPKTKRFARRRSQQSDRSIDSKKSRQNNYQTPLKLNDIPPIDPKMTKIHLSGGDFFQHLASSVMLSEQLQPNQQRYARGRTERRPAQSRKQYSEEKTSNFECHNQALMAELQVRNKELQLMVSELQMIKETMKQEDQRRKRLQQQKKQITGQLSQKIKQLQKLQIQNKKLSKQKEYLIKQIQFLERINYDDKTRNAQSYRQKYLTKEVQQLRKQLNMSKSEMQKHLQSEIKRISDQKYSIETLHRALKVEKETLVKQIEMYRKAEKNQKTMDKIAVYNSEQYVKLMKKYHSCLDTYKELKIKYMEVQKELNRSLNSIPSHFLNSDSSLSIVLSSSSSQEGHSIDKENKKLTRMAKNQLMIESIQDKSPSTKSLSPRNRQEMSPKNRSNNRRESDVKKPISPVSNKQGYELYDLNISSPEPKLVSKIVQRKPQKPQKRITYFNDEYRLKIGLGRTPHAQK